MPANEANVRKLMAAIQRAMTEETCREDATYSADDVISAYLTTARGACKGVLKHGADEQAIISILQSIILEISTPKGTVA